jgi:3-deoxy-D-manno-octulosonic-acid transferase
LSRASGSGGEGRGYRGVLGTLYSKVVSGLLGGWVSRKRGAVVTSPPRSPEGGVTVWFHGASAGEVETLWPVVEDWLEDSGHHAIVTSFSGSAAKTLERLREALRGKPGRTIAIGCSPWEGEWREWLRAGRVRAFVSAKYEAWPGLWLDLSAERVPLVVVAARPRGSLTLARWACRALGAPLPRMTFLCASEEDAHALRAEFPGAAVSVAGDPRWERVRRRMAGSGRAGEIAHAAAGMPRPWGVLAQVWEDDLRIWKEPLSRHRGGTLWVVPHEPTPERVKSMRRFLDDAGRGEEPGGAGPVDAGASGAGVVVEEMGVLTELYGHMDWAYVGGGFGRGVHSTIEPALHGLPISCGPNGADRSAEFGLLMASGQLGIVSSAEDVQRWLEGRASSAPEERARWRDDARRQAGAAAKVLKTLGDMLPS